MLLSVIIPTHNPDAERLQRTLAGLRNQTLSVDLWEAVVVDNASTRIPDGAFFARHGSANIRLVSEPQLGLTAARQRGFADTRGEICVLVDDDNVLAPNYLAETVALFDASPRLGAVGGKSIPEFAIDPPDWTREFFPLLALRDLGAEPLTATSLRAPGSNRDEYPPFAPIGAGMALRRPAWTAWLEARANGTPLSDRRGQELSSSGDNDIVLCALRAGWGVAYSPRLSLTHLIPAGRLDPDYLARLNRGINRSWMHVLTLHAVNPWPPLTRNGAALRKIKAWFRCHPWTSAPARIRYAGVCGHFDGRVPQ